MSHHRIPIDGASLHWAELAAARGSSSATPVVLLHGLTDSHLTWRDVAPLLARDRRVLMPDVFGCGLSERPDATYALEWHARVIASWIEATGLERVDIVGHSFGGGVAQMLLLASLPRIRRLALVASGGLGRDIGFWLKLAAFPKVVEHFGQPFMGLGTRLALSRLHRGYSVHAMQALSAMNSEVGTARAFSRTVRDVIDFRGQRRLFYQRAREVAMLPPIRAFWGDADTLIPIAHGHDFVAATQNVHLEVFAGCGHYLHLEQPEAFARALNVFLDSPSVPNAVLRTVGDETPSVTRAMSQRFLDLRLRLLRSQRNVPGNDIKGARGPWAAR